MISTVWGGYTVILNLCNRLKIKILKVNPRSRLSLQRHLKRSEIWIGFGFHQLIPKGKLHRLCNFTEDVMYVVEIQYGKCSEEDVERILDDYGRA